MSALRPEEFDAFFRELHDLDAFPWQSQLLRRLAATGAWPKRLDLPTGSGKTAALEIALFHLALEADRGPDRRAPLRIAFVVDRRLVVDDAHARAVRIAAALRAPPAGSVCAKVAAALQALAGSDAPPVDAVRLRGGAPLQRDWCRSPTQPILIASTVDQVGSRLLFRGYGVSDRMKSVQAGLFGADCLVLLDEAHLAEPFRQTLAAMERFRPGRDAPRTPFAVAQLSATARDPGGPEFGLEAEDFAHPVLRRRLHAAKPSRLVDCRGQEEARITLLADEAEAMLRSSSGALRGFPAIGVVVNRVARARAVFDELRVRLRDNADLELLIGAARPADRLAAIARLAPIRTGSDGRLERPLIIVGTQTIEAGADFDFDGLVTELASLDALRQRFGRLNRNGEIADAGAAIVITAADVAKKAVDPVYGVALRETADYLREIADGGTVDFGILALERLLADAPPKPETLSPQQDAPVLLPAHLDLWTRTAPVPLPDQDPDIGLYLHGAQRDVAGVNVLWRADLEDAVAAVPSGSRPEDWAVDEVADGARAAALLALVPPRNGEMIELPIAQLRAFLKGDRALAAELADAPARPGEIEERGGAGLWAFRWAGPDSEATGFIRADKVRPGDCIVLPAFYGGADAYGWSPASRAPVEDVHDLAAEPYAAHAFAVRLSRGLLGGWSALPEALESTAGLAPAARIRALATYDWPKGVSDRLAELARHGRRLAVTAEPYAADDGAPRGLVLLARGGLRSRADAAEGPSASTEDDALGATGSHAITLDAHDAAVAERAGAFARRLGHEGLAQEILAPAGKMHDLGKADPRFQAALRDGDGFALFEPDAVPLAKSTGIRLREAERRSSLPKGWRHEALSVRIARAAMRFRTPAQEALVLWLIGTHHGHGRPLFPHDDPAEAREMVLPPGLGLPAGLAPSAGPQSREFDLGGLDWETLQQRLQARHGRWELAWMEALLRLADHAVSAQGEGTE